MTKVMTKVYKSKNTPWYIATIKILVGDGNTRTIYGYFEKEDHAQQYRMRAKKHYLRWPGGNHLDTTDLTGAV